MRKKLIILICLIGLITVFGLSVDRNVEASYDDIPYVESTLPTA